MARNPEARSNFLSAIKAQGYGDTAILTKREVDTIIAATGLPFPMYLYTEYKGNARGTFRNPACSGSDKGTKVAKVKVAKPVKVAKKAKKVAKTAPAPVETTVDVDFTAPALSVCAVAKEDHVPSTNPNYVPWGNTKDVVQIIKSGEFFPCFVTGLSGNGKTEMIEQACAKTGRELFRVNITSETDEDDLLGGFRLVNGQTVWFNGPVVEAMNRGAILLLDEVDLGSNKLMILQPVLEGKPVLLKKINKVVRPEAGFNVLATANTKGRGDDTGKFNFTGILNEAFLERFQITLEQPYPHKGIEEKILTKIAVVAGVEDAAFITNLVEWGSLIRKAFFDCSVEDLISTRRLIGIVRSYGIFGDKVKAIQYGLNRFDSQTAEAFLNFYQKIDASFTTELEKQKAAEAAEEALENGATIQATAVEAPAAPAVDPNAPVREIVW